MSALRNYLEHGFPHIGGWCYREAAEITGLLVRLARDLGATGGACEIGVYHGKFFITLANAVEQRSLAIDIFDAEAWKAADGSDHPGEIRKVFEMNIAAYCKYPVEMMCRDSFSLTPQDIEAIMRNGPLHRPDKCAVFSIDGGHTAEHVVNDYQLAEAMTHDAGMIVIDDAFSPHWPGVVEGIARIYLCNPRHGPSSPKFVPVLIGFNKLWLAGWDRVDDYLAFLRKLLPEMGLRYLERRFYACDVLSIDPGR
jgi:hypothetical protein